MVRSVLRDLQGHETRFHADVTDRDRDESSRRAIGAWVRTNPQTQARWEARIRAPFFSRTQEASRRVQDVMTEGVKTISPRLLLGKRTTVQPGPWASRALAFAMSPSNGLP